MQLYPHFLEDMVGLSVSARLGEMQHDESRGCERNLYLHRAPLPCSDEASLQPHDVM